MAGMTGDRGPVSERAWLLAVALAAALVRGVKEGIVMYPAGPREHPWFRYYHALDPLKSALECGAAVALWLWWRDLGVLWCAGAAAGTWEFVELTYALARTGAFALPAYENVLGLGLYLTGWPLATLRVGRWAVLAALVVTLMLGGRS